VATIHTSRRVRSGQIPVSLDRTRDLEGSPIARDSRRRFPSAGSLTSGLMFAPGGSVRFSPNGPGRPEIQAVPRRERFQPARARAGPLRFFEFPRPTRDVGGSPRAAAFRTRAARGRVGSGQSQPPSTREVPPRPRPKLALKTRKNLVDQSQFPACGSRFLSHAGASDAG
jgi:hypothetical protein